MGFRKRILRMKWLGIVCLGAVVFSVFSAFAAQGGSKGIEVRIRDRAGKEVGLYKGSYALLVGVSKYTAGWPPIEGIPQEISLVDEALKEKGFQVVKVLNPTGDQLAKAFDDFIDTYGYDPENRLLFFFSGHGYTRHGGQKGYLVPADAPDPRSDEKGFLKKALGMEQILAWCRKIEAKHALFLFDSCFSGTIFTSKALPAHPPHITDVTSKAVRQFMSAGSAGQEVPSQSVFTPLFVRAIRGEADLDKDGYVTGTELGMYLHKTVVNYDTRQTPQYGKMRDVAYDEGDFVFQITPKEGPPGRDEDEARKRLEEELMKAQAEREAAERRAKELEEKRKIADLEQKITEERQKKEEAERRLKEQSVAAIPEKPKATPPSSTSNEIARDGVYIAYANGIVKDTKTGVEWVAGPDKDMTWDQAKAWVQSLNIDGGGWRMPTMDELAGLYKRGAGDRNMTPLLKTSGWWVWSGEIDGSSDARYFTFSSGDRGWYGRNSSTTRAFAVRSRGGG